ncbi:MAG: hypothetical protein QXV97_00715 [Candidatus Caldarchaeum sp.]
MWKGDCGGGRWTSSRKVVVFQLGAAVKPSLLNENRRDKLLRLIQLLNGLQYSYLVVDSERSADDLSISDYSMLAEVCGQRSTCTPILTIPVRRSDFHERFSEFLEVVSQHGVGGVCFVAGNPAYLDEHELRVRPGRLILDASAAFRGVAPHLPLMVGSEKIVKTALKASQLYHAWPLILLNPGLHEELKLYDGLTAGVYAPFHISETLERDVSDRLQAYISRRKTSLGFWEAVEAFSLAGGLWKIRQRVSRISEIGVDVLVGYPLDLSGEQLRRFAKVLRM